MLLPCSFCYLLFIFIFGFVVAGVMVKHMMMTIITLIMRNLTLKGMTTMVPLVSMKLIVSMGRM